jgi:hypothetical protein
MMREKNPTAKKLSYKFGDKIYWFYIISIQNFEKRWVQIGENHWET